MSNINNIKMYKKYVRNVKRKNFLQQKTKEVIN